MESLLEVLVGMYFMEDGTERDDKEYALLYSCIEGTEVEDLLHEAIYWIEFTSGEISEDLYHIMTDENYGRCENGIL